MTNNEWREYHRRLVIRERNRNRIRTATGWPDSPALNWAHSAESQYAKFLKQTRKVHYA